MPPGRFPPHARHGRRAERDRLPFPPALGVRYRDECRRGGVPGLPTARGALREAFPRR